MADAPNENTPKDHVKNDHDSNDHDSNDHDSNDHDSNDHDSNDHALNDLALNDHSSGDNAPKYDSGLPSSDSLDDILRVQIFKDIHESFLALKNLITEQRTSDHPLAQAQANWERNQHEQRDRLNANGADQASNSTSLESQTVHSVRENENPRQETTLNDAVLGQLACLIHPHQSVFVALNMNISMNQFKDVERMYRNDTQRINLEILIMACDRMFNQHLSVNQLTDHQNQHQQSQQRAGTQSATASTDDELISSLMVTINPLAPKEQQTSSMTSSFECSTHNTKVKSVRSEQVFDDQSTCSSGPQVQHQLLSDQHLHYVAAGNDQEPRLVNTTTDDQLKAYTIDEIAGITGKKLLDVLWEARCWDAYHKLCTHMGIQAKTNMDPDTDSNTDIDDTFTFKYVITTGTSDSD